MFFYSTRNPSKKYSLREAVLKGLPDDNGLFMPQYIPTLPESFFSEIRNKNLEEISFDVASAFIGDDVPHDELRHIIHDAINFDAPLVKLNDDFEVLELFHGPTLAFKDFGARFMARLFSFFIKDENQKLTILVATSGDTGSAVANGFYEVEGIDVVILYPSGKVSSLQEKQFTTLEKNITALEIKGTFDDCQRMVKEAFHDRELNQKFSLTSANSINISRLIPQTFYYFYAFARHPKRKPLVFSVPSGNFGNLTAGLFAKKMELEVERFIASTNVNDIVPHYLLSGNFNPKPSVQTISNAMDVGNPSNFARMLDLYHQSADEMRKDICSYAFTDEETKSAMKNVYEKYGYILDPHGAVGFLGAKKYLEERHSNAAIIILETAHPAKFKDIVEEVLEMKIDLPSQLKEVSAKKKKSILMGKEFSALKEFLLSKK